MPFKRKKPKAQSPIKWKNCRTCRSFKIRIRGGHWIWSPRMNERIWVESQDTGWCSTRDSTIRVTTRRCKGYISVEQAPLDNYLEETIK